PLELPERRLEVRAQARERERSQLRHPRLANPNRLPDLRHRQFFFVVEREDLALAFRQLTDRVGEPPAQLGAMQLRVGPFIGVEAQLEEWQAVFAGGIELTDGAELQRADLLER